MCFELPLLKLSFASNTISCECIIKTAEPILMAIKKELFGRSPMCLFYYSNFCFVESWKLFTTVATSPYHVFVPSKVSMLKLMLYLGSLRRNSIAVCHESGHRSL